MKSRLILAASIALALAAPAFAQDNPPPTPTPAPADDQAAPADAAADTTPAPKAVRRHRTRHARVNNSHMAAHMDAHLALTGDEPRIVAYQGSAHFKNYPAVDPGHVPGDPPVIDHSMDRAGSPAPTKTTVVVPPGH
jgi:hypothetical protein